MDLNDWDNLFIKTYKEQLQYLAQLGRSNFIEEMGDIMLVRVKMVSVSSAVSLGWTGSIPFGKHVAEVSVSHY
jgi:hypothetical protein